MPRRPAPLPSRFSNTPFRVADALEAGVGRNRLARGDLTIPARGVRLPSGQDEFVHRVMALGLLLRQDQHVSHVSAAQLWSCPLPRWATIDSAPIHVATVGLGPIERRVGIVGHRIATDRASTAVIFGVRVSNPASAWYECRTLLSVRELVVLGDHMVGVGRLTTQAQLRATIRRGDRGVTAARAALEQIRVGSESPMETILRLIVTDAGFPEPALNVDVHDAEGRFIGRADMAWPELRIALEHDGDHHRTDPATFHRDRQRSNAFTSSGWSVIRTTAPDIRAPAAFLEELRRAFARAHDKVDRASREVALGPGRGA
ncbi:hypothetical protein [Curtobacterium oceanosedimentum]|uniref:hypothetical protein n=1 Tax=Curtobacterium oceanosedimentum TaxID=465820 RepID=UPI001CE0AFCA|nr:hypothetical protein [Curtobacterium oceanosedimentum]MCA5924499.1 hypothetical protein [Curtobacterium oceanosedimentum]